MVNVFSCNNNHDALARCLADIIVRNFFLTSNTRGVFGLFMGNSFKDELESIVTTNGCIRIKGGYGGHIINEKNNAVLHLWHAGLWANGDDMIEAFMREFKGTRVLPFKQSRYVLDQIRLMLKMDEL